MLNENFIEFKGSYVKFALSMSSLSMFPFRKVSLPFYLQRKNLRCENNTSQTKHSIDVKGQ